MFLSLDALEYTKITNNHKKLNKTTLELTKKSSMALTKI